MTEPVQTGGPPGFDPKHPALRPHPLLDRDVLGSTRGVLLEGVTG